MGCHGSKVTVLTEPRQVRPETRPKSRPEEYLTPVKKIPPKIYKYQPGHQPHSNLLYKIKVEGENSFGGNIANIFIKKIDFFPLKNPATICLLPLYLVNTPEENQTINNLVNSKQAAFIEGKYWGLTLTKILFTMNIDLARHFKFSFVVVYGCVDKVIKIKRKLWTQQKTRKNQILPTE